MKKTSSLITYLAALVIGIILLSFHEIDLTKGIVVAIGILITVPSAIMFFSSFFKGKLTSEGANAFPAWYTVIVACAGLVLGIWMIVMPSMFEAIVPYTLGCVLLLVGAAQMVFIYLASRPYGANPLWYIVPVLSLTAGFILFFIGQQEFNLWAKITAGIVLIVVGANGLASLGREYRVSRERRIEGIKTDDGDLAD